MPDESFTTEDLSLLGGSTGSAGGGAGEDGTGQNGGGTSAAAAQQTSPAPVQEGSKPAAGQEAPAAQKTEPAQKPKSIAAGTVEDEPKPEPKKDAWPEDWRAKLAEHIAAGDKKIYDKELKRLQRITDPAGIYGMYRELETKFTGGGLLKVPGKDAKPEEIAAYNKARGVPEKVEDYFSALKLDNGAVVGDADKPLVNYFAEAAQKSGVTPAEFSGLMNAYYARAEQQAAELDQADDTFLRESQRALKDEYGAAFQRKTNAIATIFAGAPGGANVQNEGALISRLLGGRMADGKIIGNDPDMVKFLVSIAEELNPAATIVEDGNQSGMSLDAEIEKIEGIMRTNRREYDTKHAGRYRELLETREKIRARAR